MLEIPYVACSEQSQKPGAQHLLPSRAMIEILVEILGGWLDSQDMSSRIKIVADRVIMVRFAHLGTRCPRRFAQLSRRLKLNCSKRRR